MDVDGSDSNSFLKIQKDPHLGDDPPDHSTTDIDDEIDTRSFITEDSYYDIAHITDDDDDDDDNIESRYTIRVVSDRFLYNTEPDTEYCLEDNNTTNEVEDYVRNVNTPFKKVKRYKWTRKHITKGCIHRTSRIKSTDRIFCANSNSQRNKNPVKPFVYKKFKEGKEWENYLWKITGVCIVVDNKEADCSSNADLCNSLMEVNEDENMEGNTTTTDNITDVLLQSPTRDDDVNRDSCKNFPNDSTNDKQLNQSSEVEYGDFLANYSISFTNDLVNKKDDIPSQYERSVKFKKTEENNSKGTDEENGFVQSLSIVVRNDEDSIDKERHRTINIGETQTNIDDSVIKDICIVVDNTLESSNAALSNELRVSDIAIVVDNIPNNNNKTAEEWLDNVKKFEYLSSFQRICHRHFISQNCDQTSCQLLHVIPNDFEHILQNFDFNTTMKAYDWIKGTMLFEHMFIFFVNALVSLKKHTELSDIILDIFHQNCCTTNKTELVKIVLKALQTIGSYTFQEVIEFIILRHGISKLELCDSLLKIIAEEPNLSENWFLVKKLITFRTIKLPDCVVVNMISMCMSECPRNVNLCKNINESIIMKKLANTEKIPTLFLKEFYKTLEILS